MQFRYNLDLDLGLESRYCQNTFFLIRSWWVGVNGKIISRIRLTSAKVEVEVEAELGNYTRYTVFED